MKVNNYWMYTKRIIDLNCFTDFQFYDCKVSMLIIETAVILASQKNTMIKTNVLFEGQIRKTYERKCMNVSKFAVFVAE